MQGIDLGLSTLHWQTFPHRRAATDTTIKTYQSPSKDILGRSPLKIGKKWEIFPTWPTNPLRFLRFQNPLFKKNLLGENMEILG